MDEVKRHKQFSEVFDNNGALIRDRINLRVNGTVVKPSGFPEYDNLTGYVEHCHAREWTDKAGVRWRKVVTVINLGRPDRGTLADPDAQLQREKIERYEPVARKKSTKQITERGEFDEQIPAYLREYGPSHAKMIAADLGYHYESLHYHIKSKVGTVYCACGKVGKTVIWGLVGVHDATT